MGGPNLEVFKFGMYIMFPIGFMYYFGTNLESRFSVPDFWPKPEATYKIPFERDEIQTEIEHQRHKRLVRRRERLERDAMADMLAPGSTLPTNDVLVGQSNLPWWFPGDMRRRIEAERRGHIPQSPNR